MSQNNSFLCCGEANVTDLDKIILTFGHHTAKAQKMSNRCFTKSRIVA